MVTRGFHGKIPLQGHSFTYETYLVNGLQDGIVANVTNRTFIPAGKTEEMFAEDNNGTPSLTGRIAIKKRKTGEIGLSFYTGPYNTFRADGLTLDEKER